MDYFYLILNMMEMQIFQLRQPPLGKGPFPLYSCGPKVEFHFVISKYSQDEPTLCLLAGFSFSLHLWTLGYV